MAKYLNFSYEDTDISSDVAWSKAMTKFRLPIKERHVCIGTKGHVGYGSIVFISYCENFVNSCVTVTIPK